MRNRRSQPTALALCFFLGFLGAHWLYLGRTGRGILHLCLCLGLPGAALLVTLLLTNATAPRPLLPPEFAVPAALLLIIAEAMLPLMVLADFFTLLTTPPRTFDQEYNR